MDKRNNPKDERNAENDILFSKSVKAGKRIYYIDVKRDRKGEYYISMTESKRLKDQGETSHPVFEKHKIFLYREDLEKFQLAFNEAADFTRDQSRGEDESLDWDETLEHLDSDEEVAKDYKIDIEF